MSENKDPNREAWIPYVVGVALLVGYAGFVLFLADKVTLDKEIEWSRLQYLFNGVEALAFGAAGFIFGREVNRGRAEAAEARANDEAERASGAEKEKATAKARGQALSEQLQRLADGATTEGDPALRRIAPPDDLAAAAAVQAREIQGIARTAQQWFPVS